jgi:cytochrome b
MKPIRIWDLPTRLFHWSLAACVLVSFVTAKLGGNAMVWHFRAGHAILALLLFRLIWGFVGGHWSRFARFVRGPKTVLAYLRGGGRDDPTLDVGHNPLGALSVLAVLGVLIAQVLTGLVADDDIANQGPLNRYVSRALAARATGWHAQWGEYLIIGLVVLHVLAIAWHTMRGHALLGAMLSGDKELDATVHARVTPARDTAATRGVALVIFALCLGVAWGLGRLA